MKVGVFQLLPGGHGRSAGDVYQQNLELARLADELGFHSVWVAEHHFSEYGMVADPLMYLAAVAAQTKRIRLGTGVVVLPLYNPVRLAENAAFVDVLSGGRLDLGIGRGYQPHEFAGFGIPQEEAQERTAEAIVVLKKLWTEEKVTWDGRFFKLNEVSVLPRPIQSPHPPLWTAAVSPSTFERAGRQAEPILTSPNFTPIDMIKENFDAYRSALSANGADPAHYEYPVMQQVYVGEDARRAYEEPQQASMEYFALLGRLLPKELRESSDVAASDSYSFYRKVGSNIAGLKYDFLVENGVCFGDANTVVERIKRLEAEVGMTYFMAWLNFGSLAHDLVVRSMRRFAEDVLPLLNAEGTPAAALG
jgi:natural product biosynthesis luciferase-like monooxygenase protein